MPTAIHIDERQLALFTTGELGLIERTRVRLHLGGCERCRQELAAFEEARAILESEIKHAPESLEGASWDRLAAEISANIRLGVEAGECVRQAEPERVVSRFDWASVWRPGLAVAGLVLVLYGGTWIAAKRLSPDDGVAQSARQTTLEALPDSLEIRSNGAAFSLVRASTAPVALSVGRGGSLAAREVDEDTGEVTIYHVYAQ